MVSEGRMRVRLLVVAALLVAGTAMAAKLVLAPGRPAAGMTVTAALRCNVNQRSDGFRITQIRAGGNSLESYQRVPTCFAESDLHLTPHGAIIGGHDEELGGNCGLVHRSTPRTLEKCKLANGEHIATLGDFLRLPLAEWFLDLKTTQSEKDQEVVKAVQVAIDDIRAAGRKQGAVLMMYRAPPAAVDLVRQHGIRAGMKGYPETIEGTRRLVLEAKANGFEMVCVNISVIDKDLVVFAKGLGVWLLAWEGHDDSTTDWHELAEAGLGGLITDRIEFVTKAMQRAAP